MYSPDIVTVIRSTATSESPLSTCCPQGSYTDNVEKSSICSVNSAMTREGGDETVEPLAGSEDSYAACALAGVVHERSATQHSVASRAGRMAATKSLRDDVGLGGLHIVEVLGAARRRV